MKRGKKTSPDDPVATRDYVKCTYLLDRILIENLRYIALARNQEQTDLVREILAEFIISQGLDPTKRPVFVFSGHK